MNDQKWIDGLKEFLYTQILPMAEPDPERRMKLLSKNEVTGYDPMITWIAAFTSETYNPNVGENYEELETLGDSAMKYAFKRYLRERYPGINRGELSELSNHYLSKPLQAPVGYKLKLQDWVRTPVDKNTHMFEDLLESLFGALSEIGDNVFAFGAGYVLCYRLLVSIYNKIDIDLNVLKGHIKTQVKEIFDKLGLGKLGPDVEKWVPYGDGTRGTLYFKLSVDAVYKLRLRGIDLRNDVIAEYKANTKKETIVPIYNKVLEAFNKMGINEQYIEEEKYRTLMEDPELQPFYVPALQRLESEGFCSMYTKFPRIGNKGYFAQLIGERENGRLQVLETVSVLSIPEGKKEVLRLYASGS